MCTKYQICLNFSNFCNTQQVLSRWKLPGWLPTEVLEVCARKIRSNLLSYSEFITCFSRILNQRICKFFHEILFFISKGQLISKCPFGVIVWTKIAMKIFSRISALASKKRSNQKSSVRKSK